MPRWVVRCPNCGQIFTHSQIEAAVLKEGFRDPFHVIPKPAMPQAGDKRTCAVCKAESSFHPHNLLYREDGDGAGAC